MGRVVHVHKTKESKGDTMKKYPVTYKGKEYEVRWEQIGCLNYISIYEVIEGRIFKRFKIYKSVYSELKSTIDEVMYMSKNDPTYYIEETKTLFKFWERSKKRKQEKEDIEANKLKALEEWDGEIKC